MSLGTPRMLCYHVITFVPEIIWRVTIVGHNAKNGLLYQMCLSLLSFLFFLSPFPFLCLPGLTIQTPYSQTIKTQHLLMVALASVPLEYNNIIPFSYSPLKPSQFCSAVVAPAFYSWKHASYFLSLGSLSLFICSSSNSLFLSLSSYSF